MRRLENPLARLPMTANSAQGPPRNTPRNYIFPLSWSTCRRWQAIISFPSATLRPLAGRKSRRSGVQPIRYQEPVFSFCETSAMNTRNPQRVDFLCSTARPVQGSGRGRFSPCSARSAGWLADSRPAAIHSEKLDKNMICAYYPSD